MSDGALPTLGNGVIKWIEANLVIPDGEFQGQPFKLAAWQKDFIRGMYALHLDAEVDLTKPSRAFAFTRGAQLVAPQKFGKGPLSAALIIAEGYGPVLFNGWSGNTDRYGLPVPLEGRPWATPWIQVTAVSEDQTDNVWRSLIPMITLSRLISEIPDTGETRINLPNGGRIEPVTASARSRLGQRITFVNQDEAHDWLKTNGGRKLADTQRRNLAGMGGRFLETGNAWDPNEISVAQTTFEDETSVFKLMLHPKPGSVKNKTERMRVIKDLYAGSWWVDPERISEEIDALVKRGDYAQAERFFLNRVVPGEDRAFDAERWADLARTDTPLPADRETIVIGVDGARYRDALAVVACHVASGFMWPLIIMERPPDAPDEYEHDFEEVDSVVSDAWQRWKVWRIYVDPGSQVANITPLLERWQGRWGEKRIIEFAMNRPRQTAYMIRKFSSSIVSGDLTHDGNEHLARHMANARRKSANVRDEDGREMYLIQKESPGSPKKIDGAAAAALAWEARGDAVSAGKSQKSVYSARTCTCNRFRTRHAPIEGCPGYKLNEEQSGAELVHAPLPEGA